MESLELHELGSSPRPDTSSAPRPIAGIENASFEDEEAGARVRVTSSTTGPNLTACDGQWNRPITPPRSEDELELRHEDRSVDYGFYSALIFLVSGIILVVIAYTIPREARVDPDRVTARQMEKLELYYAQLGSHLDKCIIAGLGLLTMGGMLLSVLLMVTICKGDVYRRRSFSTRPLKSYGSVNMRLRHLAEADAECDQNLAVDIASSDPLPPEALHT